MSVQAIIPAQTRQTLRSFLPQSLLNWREALFYGRFGEVEVHLFEFLCRWDADALDVGAKDGRYVTFLRRNARRVVAFEPQPLLAEALRQKFPGIDVRVEQIALSNEVGSVELMTPAIDADASLGPSSIPRNGSASCPIRQAVKIPMAPLDSVYRGHAGFMKIDVAGREQAILDGSVHTIRRCRPRLLVRIDDQRPENALAFARAYFDRLGYTGHFVRQGRLEPMTSFYRESMQRPVAVSDFAAPLSNGKCSGAPVYNFIFLPPDEPVSTIRRISDRLAAL